VRAGLEEGNHAYGNGPHRIVRHIRGQEIQLTSPARAEFYVLVKLTREDELDADLLHTEKILADRKTFYLDLKQNSRGMVVKITEDVGGNRDTIMVPAEILGDFIAALTDIKQTADEQG
jgi:hypothetical protein